MSNAVEVLEQHVRRVEESSDVAACHDVEFSYVKVGDCFVDMTYGRLVLPQHLRKFDRWDDKKVSAIVLSRRTSGEYAILDGGHRVTKYRQLHGDNAVMPAIIYTGLAVDEEAAIFSGLNRDRKKTTPTEEFKADVVAGVPDAVEIQRILDDLGLHFNTAGVSNENGIDAVEAVRKIYRDHGGNSLRELLRTLRDTMGTGQGAIQGAIIKGLAAFAVRYYSAPQFNKDRLNEVLSTHSPAQIKSHAHTIRSSSGKIDQVGSVGMALLYFYNTGLRRGKLPEWQARGR